MTAVVPHTLQVLSAAAIGLYAGAMLTLAWRSGAARRLPAFLGPLTWLAALLSLSGAVAAQSTVAPGRWSALAAAMLMVPATAPFFGSSELARRMALHRGRAAAGLAAFVAALLSLARVG